MTEQGDYTDASCIVSLGYDYIIPGGKIEMNSLEICMASIRGEKTERIPIDLHNFMMCAEASGMEYDKFFLDSNAMAEMQIEMQKRFQHDMLLVENGTATLAEATGCGVIYDTKKAPVAHSPAIQTIEDIEQMRIPEDLFEKPLIKANLETVKKLSEHFNGEIFILGRADQGPFSLASQIYGMQNFMMDLLDEDCEEEIKMLLEYCTQICILYHKKLLEMGAHMTSMGESTAGPDVMSPSMYEKFAMPYEKKVIDAVHEAGGLVSLHICGNATGIIERMVSLGADVLEIDQKTDLKVAREATKGHCALLGQISPIILNNGTKEEISEEVKKSLDIIGGTNAEWYIFGPGCALGGDTPLENVEWMIQYLKCSTSR